MSAGGATTGAALRHRWCALDLDGVIWRGDRAHRPGDRGRRRASAPRACRSRSCRTIRRCRSAASSTSCARMGVEAEPDEVITSALAAAHLLRRDLAAGATVLVCGGPGSTRRSRPRASPSVDEGPADAVVVGLQPRLLLRRARPGVGRRARRCPLRGHQPRQHLSGPRGADPRGRGDRRRGGHRGRRHARGGGKPAHPIADLVRERFGTAGVMVGDRPSTDGAMADTLGWPFALVLSGVTAAVAPPGGEAIPDPPPPFVAADLGALVDPLVAALLRLPDGEAWETGPEAVGRVSCPGDRPPPSRCRARAARPGREPPSGGRGHRRGAGPRGWQPGRRPHPDGRPRRGHQRHRRGPPLRVPGRREARRPRSSSSAVPVEPAAGRSTPAPPPAGSPTACCRRAPPTWWRSTSAAGSSRGRCARIPG